MSTLAVLEAWHPGHYIVASEGNLLHLRWEPTEEAAEMQACVWMREGLHPDIHEPRGES